MLANFASVNRPNRDLTVDALKGLAIVMVVVGHAIVHGGTLYAGGADRIQVYDGVWLLVRNASNPLLSLAYSFHIPLFAFVSGFVLWRQTLPPLFSQIRGRIRSLAIPYFAWFIVIYCLHRGFFGSVSEFILALKAVATNISAPGALWYLYTLFGCSLVVILLARLPKPEWVLLVSGVALPFVPEFLPPVSASFLDTLHLKEVYPFVVLGYLTPQHKAWIMRHRSCLALMGGLSFGLLAYLRYPVHVPAAAAIEGVISWLNHLDLPSAHLARVVPKLSPFSAIAALYPGYTFLRGPMLGVQVWIGRRTLGIYATHSTIQFWLTTQGVNNWLLLFGLSLLISIGVTLMIEQVPYIRNILLGSSSKPIFPAAAKSIQYEDVPAA